LVKTKVFALNFADWFDCYREREASEFAVSRRKIGVSTPVAELLHLCRDCFDRHEENPSIGSVIPAWTTTKTCRMFIRLIQYVVFP